MYGIYIGSITDYMFRSTEHFKPCVLNCKFARFDLSTEGDLRNLKENLHFENLWPFHQWDIYIYVYTYIHIYICTYIHVMLYLHLIYPVPIDWGSVFENTSVLNYLFSLPQLNHIFHFQKIFLHSMKKNKYILKHQFKFFGEEFEFSVEINIFH